MKRYKSIFKEAFKGNDRIIANEIQDLYSDLYPFYRNKDEKLYNEIADQMRMGLDEVLFYIRELKKMRRI